MKTAPSAENDFPLDIADKKRLGAFYTPEALSDVLCAWAIKSPNDLVLEPSFGGCGFLKSAADRLREVGAPVSQTQLYGCDIDPQAFLHLARTFGDLADTSRFEQCDFLEFGGKIGWPETFDTVIGNPPYLPYQSIASDARAVALGELERLGLSLQSRASLWAYFVGLSLKFLKPGGRMAWVLPGSFLQANYAKGLRDFLSSRFKRIHAFQVHKRLFLYEGTDEQTIVLLGEGYSNLSLASKSEIALSSCENIEVLEEAIANWEDGKLVAGASCGTAIMDHLNEEVRELFSLLTKHECSSTFGVHADVRIGLVTGDNKFFVLSEEMALANSLDSSILKPVLTKFAYSPGLSYSEEDHLEVLSKGHRGLLVNSDTVKCEAPSLAEYLATYPVEKINTTSTFAKRQVWCKPDDGNTPNAFFPVMHHLGPRVVLNTHGANCTNTLHRVYFKDKPSLTVQRLIAVSMISTYSQLSAEIVGRKYGSGVLKHEPREAEKIRLLLPSTAPWQTVSKVFREIDGYLRNGRVTLARRTADEFLLGQALGADAKTAQRKLGQGLLAVRKQRHPDRQKTAR